MTEYEITLLWAVVLLIAAVITGFTAVTNRRPVAPSLILFVIGGLALYYASSLGGGSNIAADIPGAVYKLYAKLMN